MGYIRLQVQEHTIVEAHPESENPDLRLTAPWPTLKEYLDSFDITTLDSKARSHTPAIVILYYYLQKYKELNGGKYSSIDELRNILLRNYNYYLLVLYLFEQQLQELT